MLRVALWQGAYVNVLPGAGIVVLQSVMGFFWATRSKTILFGSCGTTQLPVNYDADITGQDQIKGREFVKKLEATYGHLFKIVARIPVSDEINEALTEVASYPVIFIYDIPLGETQ